MADELAALIVNGKFRVFAKFLKLLVFLTNHLIQHRDLGDSDIKII
ncbi:hypothetical protein [Liquorilactobacillus uvarum]|nr:hypothetical protein [Liquorilactobacillus uvarum]